MRRAYRWQFSSGRNKRTFFHCANVTSNLARSIPISDDYPGRDGPIQSKPSRPNSCVRRILILNFFEKGILRGIPLLTR